MANKEYEIGMLWIEGSLSFLEQLCIQSFMDAGHHVALYHYGALSNVPDGTELRDANSILPSKTFLKYKTAGSPALHADQFRFRLLATQDRMIWADTDAYCMKPFWTKTGHFYGWESEKLINSGVLGLPKDCDTLHELIEFTEDEYSIPTWYGDDYTQKLTEARDAGTPVHASQQPWGVWGPHALTHFLHKTGEARHALPQDGLYPFTFKDRRLMLRRNFDTTGYITENTYSVHLYGRRMRARIVEKEGGAPHPKSLLGKLLVKHGIDPARAPIPIKPEQKKAMEQAAAEKAQKAAAKSQQADTQADSKPKIARHNISALPASARYGIGDVNITDLADRYDLNRGPKKHRFSELYQMLFHPLRKRMLHITELGIGAEEAASKGQSANEMSSARMWLEYFPKARLHALDTAQTPKFEHSRFSYHKVNFDSRTDLDTVCEDLPEMDIVIDAATQASHHQQNSFLTLFPKLKSGGLYIIEGLRWQPKQLERDGITKTSDLLYGYSKTGVFEHTDSDVMSEFNALRSHISGCFVFQAGFDVKKRHQIAVIHKR